MSPHPVVVFSLGIVSIRFARMYDYDYSGNCSKLFGFWDNQTLFY